jgi:ribosomal-protein-alanine N-acetyltransferase
MGNRGRFGKYGEIKRKDRLKKARISSRRASNIKPPRRKPSFKTLSDQKASVKIRPARPSDAHFIGQLSGRAFHMYGPYKDTISRWFESEMTFTLVALLDRKPVGFAMIGYRLDEGTPRYVSELLAIAVERDRQRMGIGQMLLLEIEKKAVELDLKRMVLHTAIENIAAQRLFTRNGYSRWAINRNFYPSGQDAVLMIKDIQPWSSGWED